MRKAKTIRMIMAATLAVMTACAPKNEPQENYVYGHKPEGTEFGMHLVDDRGWMYAGDEQCDSVFPIDKATFVVKTDTAIRLSFYGWSADEDHRFTLACPESTEEFGRCILEYTMCGWNKGPAEWDMTTLIMVRDKKTGEWYEFSRCITPYGGSFRSGWKRTYYMDVTPLMPMLEGETEFRIFYCGWDATSTRAHAAQIALHYIPGKQAYGTPAWHRKVYDSTLNGNSGYRSWAYGIQPDSTGTSHSIEDAERLGVRTIALEPGTKTVILRSCFTGHGQDALTVGNGTFPERPGYRANSVAEFDQNRYTVTLNGTMLEEVGTIWEINSSNYKQAGTYKYNRAGWGPGKPCNVHWWVIENIPEGMDKLTLDLNLYEYISKNVKPNAESVAQFYVEVDAYGYR